MSQKVRWYDDDCVGEPRHQRTAWSEHHSVPSQCFQCMGLLAAHHMRHVGFRTESGVEADLRRIFRKAFVSHLPTPLAHYVTLYYAPANLHYALRLRPGTGLSWYGMCIAKFDDHGKVMSAVMGDIARFKKKREREDRSREQRRAYRIAQESAEL